MTRRLADEWPTLALLVLCYALWGIAITVAAEFWVPLGICLAAIAITLHASLTHEIIHGHPTANARLNSLLVWPAIGLLVPYGRFRDTHLAHHMDAKLTDPYEDPESNYLDPRVWSQLPSAIKGLLRLNNTLLGRILLGPMIGQFMFMACDWKDITSGDRRVANAWVAHLVPATLIVAVVAWAPIPLWAYTISVYLGHAILRIRTFLEHQAHEHCAARTVLIEDRGPLSLLFLNNNFHLVHHMHPCVAWHRLPAVYATQQERFLTRNQGYRYRSYREIFARYLLAAKDPVPHPLWVPSPNLTRNTTHAGKANSVSDATANAFAPVPDGPAP